MADVTCARCGQTREGFDRPPFPGPGGARGVKEIWLKRWSDCGRCRLGRSAPGQCAHSGRHGEEIGPSVGKGGGHCRPACQYVRGLCPIGTRRGGERRSNQARRPRRAGSDGRWVYMGRSSAQVLNYLEFPATSRIADTTEFRYECVIEAAGARRQAGRITWPISGSRGSLKMRTPQTL